MVIGITMRVIENEAYSEQRDALSKDWYDYIDKVLPEAVLVPLVNQPQRIIRTLEALQVEGIILSSGNDWGSAPHRDETEKRLIDYCLRQRLPLLGVCRGMQVLNVAFGGKLQKDIYRESKEKHVDVHHSIVVSQGPFREWCEQAQIVTNSFHNQGVMGSEVARDLEVFAQTPSGVVEGLYHQSKPVVGIQWHPERSNPAVSFDEKLITTFFQKGIFWQ